jgi:anti-anti-sigma factor
VSEFAGEVRVPRLRAGQFAWSQRPVGDGIVVWLAGELDLSTTAELRRRLMGVAGSETAATIVLDLSGVRYIDARSIGLIMAARAAAQSRGGELYVAGLHGIPARLLGLLGLDRILACHMPEADSGGDEDG